LPAKEKRAVESVQLSPLPRRGIWAVSLAALSLFGLLIGFFGTGDSDEILPIGVLISFALWFLGGLAALIMGIVAMADERRANKQLGAVAVGYGLCGFVGLFVIFALFG
jgi:hypothetical protein